MDNPFSWDYLTTRPDSNEVFGPFAIVFLIIFVIGFVATLVLYSGGAKTLIKDPIIRRWSRKWSGWLLTLFGFGLFFFAIRWLQINPLSFGTRIWLWLCLLILVGFGAYLAYDLRVHYPGAKKAYEEQQLKKQYLRSIGAPVVTGKPATAGGTVSRPTKKRRR